MANKNDSSTEITQFPLIRESKTPKDAFRNIRNYLAGQFIGATRDDVLLDEVLKCLFCKLVIERGETKPIDVDTTPFDVAIQVRKAFAIVRQDFPEIYAPDAEILLDPPALQFVVSQLDFSIMDAESDPIGDAFEVFVGGESRGNSGQFFTPRSVSSLLVKALDPQPGETVLDPACGAGGFLSSVCAHLISKGADPSKFSSNLYGIDKDAYLAQLAKVHVALLTGGHPKVINADSISLNDGKKAIRDLLPEGGVDVLLTNPPFGVRIVAAQPEVMRSFDLARKWSVDSKTGALAPTDKVQVNVPPQVLFVERCLSLLKPGGRLGMVLPESILSNKSYRHVVEYLMQHADVHGVMGMPDALFKTSGKGGTHTKTCLIVATKKTDAASSDKTPTLFMAEAKWCGQDSRARVIPHNDLPVIAENFVLYRQSRLNQPSSLGFVVAKDNVKNGVLCPRYYDPQAEEEINTLRDSHDLVSIDQLLEKGVISITTGDEVGKLAYGTGDIPFIRTSDISNWELKADPKHGVSNEIYQSLKVKQDVQVGDILMVKDGTYLIGTCAIVTEVDKEIIYQSHLYKIRVNKTEYGLNPYLLLALLSSTAVQKQIISKKFTQDIIDSLGERIKELVLPIPRSEQMRYRITDLVQSAVNKRIEARALTREARECFKV